MLLTVGVRRSADLYETSVGERTGGSTGTGPAGLEYPNDAFFDMVGETRLTLSLEGAMHVNTIYSPFD